MNRNSKLCEQNQRLLQHLNTGRFCPEEIRQLLGEITGQPISDTIQINLPFYTDFGRNIKLGQNISIGANVTFSDFALITIEDNVAIASGVDLITMGYQKDNIAPITIKKNTKIGGRSIILPGVTIGKDCFIRAGSIVDHSLPNGTEF